MYGDSDVYWSVVGRKGRVTSDEPSSAWLACRPPRNLGEVALGELSLALVPSVCSGSTPSTEEDQHHSLEPTRRPAAACLGILSIVCTVILLGGSIV